MSEASSPTNLRATGTFEIARHQQEAMAQAALSGGAPRIYANGFIIAQTSSDIAVIMMSNSAVIGVLNMSHISAKSLSAELAEAVRNFEKATHQKVKTLAEVQEALMKREGTKS